MRALPAVLCCLALATLSATASAEEVNAKKVKDVALALEQQNAKLAAAVARYETEAKKKKALEAKLAEIERQRAAAKTESERAKLTSLRAATQTELGELFTVMMAYLRMVQKEARDDRAIERQSNELKLAAAARKADLDVKKIDQEMKEAREKADAAMAAAVLQLDSAIVAAAMKLPADTSAKK